VGGDVAGAGKSDLLIEDVAALDKAGEGQISFLDNVRYKESFITSKAPACIVAPQMVQFAPGGMTLIVSKNPYKSYALVAQAFYPDAYPASSISPAAYVSPAAKIGAGCVIEPGAVIGADVILGDGCWIEANAVIGAGVQIGPKSRIGANASVSHAVIGSGTRLYPGVRVGQDGFGFAIDPAGHVKVPQLGRVMIGDHVEIGANSCIDRGAGPDTVIGDGAWIDNLVQIGHNVRIGRGCVLISQSGVAGSTVMEDYSVLAAQAGVAGHLKIGMGARIGAKSGVMKDVPAGEEQLGIPAMPVKEFMRQVVALKRLTKPQKSE
ncbi:MAG: UDP-3-O-(3-hydroxymyristoyl)glucosamine N-acyltransferase, partial [Micavibrio aeruginosavorus]